MKRPKVVQEGFNLLRFMTFKLFPEFTIKEEFKRHMGYKLNLEKPKSYNEKIQWLKLYWYDPKASICADKYTVRKYVEECGLKHILNELYGVFENVEDIDFESLPNEFVLKVTHGCGQNLICTDKSKVEWPKEKRKFTSWLKKSHYYDSLEWVYRDIKPRIVVEKLIKTKNGEPPNDYKVFCFNGEPRYMFVATDRGEGTTKFDFYDLEWNHLNVKNYYPNSDILIPRPKELDDILKYAKILSNGFPHARVDFYIESRIIIFGEITFFHFSGNIPFEPKQFDYELGGFLNLPKKNDEQYLVERKC